MSDSEVGTWFVGFDEPPGREDGAVVFSLQQQTRVRDAGVRRALPFHEVAEGGSPARSRRVVVTPPTYRGMSFYRLVSWLVSTRLARPGTVVCWRLDRKQGPKSVLALLGTLGWTLTAQRRGRITELCGDAPATHEEPSPQRFQATLGRRSFEFEADYGVFSPDRIDAGTALLIDVALARPAVATAVDVGAGYGAIALALLGSGVAGRALGTEVDSVALWLARRNARAAGLPLELSFAEDPGRLPDSLLTVCNMPTHVDRQAGRRLVHGLVQRARCGTVLVVVHASLERRYAEPFAEARTAVTVHRGASHVVLEAGRSPGR